MGKKHSVARLHLQTKTLEVLEVYRPAFTQVCMPTKSGNKLDFNKICHKKKKAASMDDSFLPPNIFRF